MYRGMKSIKPYNSKILFPAHLSECTCWCQSRVIGQLDTLCNYLKYSTNVSILSTKDTLCA